MRRALICPRHSTGGWPPCHHYLLLIVPHCRTAARPLTACLSRLRSLMIGLMYLGLGEERDQSSINSRVSVLFFVAAFLVFMSVAVLPFFVQERAIFLRERGNGYYSVPAFVLSQFVCSLPGTPLHLAMLMVHGGSSGGEEMVAGLVTANVDVVGGGLVVIVT